MFKKAIIWIYLFCLALICFHSNNLVFAQENKHLRAPSVARKAVMVIASANFRDEELLLPKGRLETNRVKVTLASSSLSPCRGMLGSVVKPDILVEDIEIEDYDAIIFIGGSGASEFWDNPTAHRIAIQAQAQQKIIAAICIAPVTLARAGILREKKATAYLGVAQELEAHGVFYTGSEVEIDANIITAYGPKAAGKFGDALVEALARRR